MAALAQSASADFLRKACMVWTPFPQRCILNLTQMHRTLSNANLDSQRYRGTRSGSLRRKRLGARHQTTQASAATVTSSTEVCWHATGLRHVSHDIKWRARAIRNVQPHPCRRGSVDHVPLSPLSPVVLAVFRPATFVAAVAIRAPIVSEPWRF